MPARDVAIAMAVAALWGFNFVVMKKAAGEVPPLLLTALRFALAAFPAILFVPRPAVPWRSLIVFGTAFGVVKFSLLFLAFRLGLPSGIGSIVLQLHVFFTVALAAVILHERPGPPQKLGLLLGLVGMATVAAGEASSAALIPVLLTAAAAFAWAVASIELKRLGPVDMLGFAVWISIVPPIPMFLLSALIEGPGAIAAAIRGVSPAGIAAVLYLAYPVSLLSTAMWSGLLTRYPAAKVLPFSLLVPLIGTTTGWLVYGEAVDTPVVIGAALVLAGLALSTGSLRWRATGHVGRG